jgi:hypothetical protein
VISVVVLLTSFAHATDCKWADGVKPVDNGYLYTKECHGRVGILVKDNDDLNIEVANLRKSIDLKNLALDKADERIILWRNESYEQFDRLQKQIEASKKNDMLWFALGIVVTGAAVWGAGQLR